MLSYLSKSWYSLGNILQEVSFYRLRHQCRLCRLKMQWVLFSVSLFWLFLTKIILRNFTFWPCHQFCVWLPFQAFIFLPRGLLTCSTCFLSVNQTLLAHQILIKLLQQLQDCLHLSFSHLPFNGENLLSRLTLDQFLQMKAGPMVFQLQILEDLKVFKPLFWVELIPQWTVLSVRIDQREYADFSR